MSAMTDRFNSNEDPAMIERDAALEYVQERLEDLHTENLKAIRAVIENKDLVLVAVPKDGRNCKYANPSNRYGYSTYTCLLDHSDCNGCTDEWKPR